VTADPSEPTGNHPDVSRSSADGPSGGAEAGTGSRLNRLADLPLFAVRAAVAAPAAGADRLPPSLPTSTTTAISGLHAVPDEGDGRSAPTLARNLDTLARPVPAGEVSLARDAERLAQRQDRPHLGTTRGVAGPATSAHPVAASWSNLTAPGRHSPETAGLSLIVPARPITHAAEPPSVATIVSGSIGVDWAAVRVFRQQAAELLTAQQADRVGLDEQGRREFGRSLIASMLRDHADGLVADGRPAPTPEQEHALCTAVFNHLFTAGRLQPLLDDPAVENIEILGCDRVHLDYGDGQIVRGPAVADSDEELIETLAFLAARAGDTPASGSNSVGSSSVGGGERSFTPATPILDLTLPGGARLAARAWITARPAVVIRQHRLRDAGLPELVGLGMLDGVLSALLTAAVIANKAIVVSGPQGAGKSTLTRAMCGALSPMERVGTIETEYELFLHEMPDRHQRVVAHQARPGSGERGLDGRAAGEITLDDLLYSCLRMNLSRIIVGEVRGKEILTLMKALQAGAGGLTTTHSHSARAAIERLVTCALEAGPHVTSQFAYRQIAHHIDLIVHVKFDDQTRSGGGRHRYISEVIELAPGEQDRVAVTDLFSPGPDGRAIPRTNPSPELLADLERAGFDPAWLLQRNGTWLSQPAPSAAGPPARTRWADR
jgi:pilus assembly protein CpaF